MESVGQVLTRPSFDRGVGVHDSFRAFRQLLFYLIWRAYIVIIWRSLQEFCFRLENGEVGYCIVLCSHSVFFRSN